MARGYKLSSGDITSSAGGSELAIVGGNTRPATATTNTIWLNTDMEITGYALAATEPESPVEGMAWVTISNSGTIKHTSPVGDEWITVYPISAMQYIGGVWVAVTAQSYQGGVWVDWFTYLFNSGDLCKDITGGWTNSEYYYYSATSYPNSNPVYGEDIKFSLTAKGACIAGTVNKIDLRGKKTLYVNCTAISTATPMVSINDAKNVHTSSSVAYATLSVGINKLDVSNIEKEAYIAVFTYSNSGAGSASVDRIWLE